MTGEIWSYSQDIDYIVLNVGYHVGCHGSHQDEEHTALAHKENKSRGKDYFKIRFFFQRRDKVVPENILKLR